MNSEDDEFNRIEREAKARMMAVQSSIGSQLRAANLEPFKPDWANFHDGVETGRIEAFNEIENKIKAMPFNDATIDSLLIWLKEQK